MTTLIKQQVEAQGVKELDRFKNFQELSTKELKEVDGGSWIGRALRWLVKHTDVAPTTIPVRDQITGEAIGNGTAYGVKVTISW